MVRQPPDILITTPESLFLVLTSQARAMLASVEVVIVDEIHTMVGTKRGAHLALSLERLQERRAAAAPADRALARRSVRSKRSRATSAAASGGARGGRGRSTIVDAGARKALDLRGRGAGRGHDAARRACRRRGDGIIEGRAAAAGAAAARIWPAIHPRLLELDPRRTAPRSCS